MVDINITYCQRGYCTKAGYHRLGQVLSDCKDLYNAALQERWDAWRMNRVNVSWIDQDLSLTAIRVEWPDREGAVDRRVQRGVLRRVEHAYQDFFRRVRSGEVPGFPRFQSHRRYRTIDVQAPTKAMLKVRGDGLKAWVKVKGLPCIKLRSSRPLPAPRDLKTLRIVWKATGVWVNLGFRVKREPLPRKAAEVGVHMGVRNRMVLSTGELVKRRKVDRSRENQLRQALERSTKRDSLGRLSGIQSNRRAKRLRILSRETERNSLRNREECHRMTTEIVRKYGRIAAAKLNIRGMTRRARRSGPEAVASESRVRGDAHRPARRGISPHDGAAQETILVDSDPHGVPVHGGAASEGASDTSPGVAKRTINREILAQSWGMILRQLRYKSEWNGRDFAEVDPAYTSQLCSRCGLTGRRRNTRFICPGCGLDYDVDLNAAANILQRAFGPGDWYLRGSGSVDGSTVRDLCDWPKRNYSRESS